MGWKVHLLPQRKDLVTLGWFRGRVIPWRAFVREEGGVMEDAVNVPNTLLLPLLLLSLPLLLLLSGVVHVGACKGREAREMDGALICRAVL
jgi:hypothetical protein